MHAQLFPALLDRYGASVHIVYRDYPLSQHPWAMRAAVDANCVGDQSTPGYWNLVDYIHSHASDFGGNDKSVQKANDELDKLALDETAKDKLDAAKVDACIKKQDVAAIKASMKMGDDLGVEATPVLFINGEKLEGAYPLVDVFRMVDGALVALGQNCAAAVQGSHRAADDGQARQLAPTLMPDDGPTPERIAALARERRSQLRGLLLLARRSPDLPVVPCSPASPVFTPAGGASSTAC